ncbi:MULTISPECIES: hypothetical protein [Delftia]|jgi:hypothetical protein|nr:MULTISPECIES: hypothetical protein [Delftia]MDC2857927.1 hypothetical protein [Delftia sp. DT-2]QRI90278.1 hypothetical protein JQN63_29765 [Delftia lacustris]
MQVFQKGKKGAEQRLEDCSLARSRLQIKPGIGRKYLTLQQQLRQAGIP